MLKLTDEAIKIAAAITCVQNSSRNMEDIKETKLKLLEMKAIVCEVKIHYMGLMAINTLQKITH